MGTKVAHIDSAVAALWCDTGPQVLMVCGCAISSLRASQSQSPNAAGDGRTSATRIILVPAPHACSSQKLAVSAHVETITGNELRIVDALSGQLRVQFEQARTKGGYSPSTNVWPELFAEQGQALRRKVNMVLRDLPCRVLPSFMYEPLLYLPCPPTGQ